MISPEGYLLDPQYNRTYNKKMNESTGLEWIDSITGDDITLKVGDEIRIKNTGNESSFLNWLGDYSYHYKGGTYGDYITGEIIEIITARGRFVLKEKNTGDEMYFPLHKMDIEELKIGNDEYAFREYTDLDMEYELLNIKY